MKNLLALIILFIAVVPFSYGQEIVPFPDLSESHLAVYNQTETIDDHNYSLYTDDYQDALKTIDVEIEKVNKGIQNAANEAEKTSLKTKKKLLFRKRSTLFEEAELIEDLNKFY